MCSGEATSPFIKVCWPKKECIKKQNNYFEIQGVHFDATIEEEDASLTVPQEGLPVLPAGQSSKNKNFSHANYTNRSLHKKN